MSAPANGSQTPRPAGRRRRLRTLLWSVAGLACLVLAVLASLVYWTGTPGFEAWVGKRIAARLAEMTGGRVEIRGFHWRPLRLEGEADGVTIHGREGPAEEPYAQIERIRTQLSILDIWSPRILLRDLEVTRPAMHLIVYPDGTTNQPKPRKTPSTSTSTLDTIFDLRAGRIAVEQGVLHYEDRAAAFDSQNRYTLLDFGARDVALQMSYAAAAAGNSERYHIEAGARDLAVSRGIAPHRSGPAEGYLQASLDLTRNSLFVRSLRLTSRSRESKGHQREHTVELAGAIEDFNRPRWQARVNGELDMGLLEAETGFADVPQGIARLDLTGSGRDGQFHFDGSIHAEGAAYMANGLRATGVEVDARLHADPVQMLITSATARFEGGGRMEGTISLSPWLAQVPGTPTMGRTGQISVQAVPGIAPPAAFRAPPPDIPMNGKVTANLKDLPLDKLLEVVSTPPLSRLGFNTVLNGPATATWSKGQTNTLVIGATLGLSPSPAPAAGEVPASGAIVATYTQRTGSVDVQRLELHTPGSQLETHGQMGVNPPTNATSIAIDFQSHDLHDFDAPLRSLGLRRRGKTGVSALPAALEGSAEFHGTWNGSLVDPHVAGTAKAAQVALETAAPGGDESAEPRWVHWDEIDASGSYSADRIEISHGTLKRDKTEIALSGDLMAAPGQAAAGHRGRPPEFNDNSTLRVRLRASHVPADQLEPLTGRNLPVAGAIDTQLELAGPIRNLSGSGWAELDDGEIYGQRVQRIRAQGKLADQTVSLSSVSIDAAAGSIQATGEINLGSRQLKVDSHGAGIDVTRIAALAGHGMDPAGRVSFTLTGAGSFDAPELDGNATIDDFAVNGQPMGTMSMSVHAARQSLTYDASTHMAAASLTLHGRTALSGDYESTAELEFSQLNIGSLLKIAHLESLSGESSLAGKVTVQGPFAHPDVMRGDLHLSELGATISGVHLKSDNGLHATLANSRVTLDPLHLTGEETDLRAQGTLALRGQRQLDFAASGSINLKLGQMLDPDLTASGTTTFQVEGHGPLKNPGLRGRIDFQNGSLALEDVPNGLSQLHGTLEFNQDRLEVRSLTAVSGGGKLSVAGYLAYQRGLFADLRVTGKGIRIRYPAGVSSLADGTFHLQGMQNNLLLSGDVLITRFSVSPELDIAALAAQANTVQPVVSQDAPSNHIRLDVRVTSSQQLNFQNTVAKLAGNVDLRLRGTMASPTLLGSVQITEGNALIAGTRYELQRGTVSFTNPVRIEPSIDLSATAHVSDYDITLGMHGTPSKLSVTYRSDPPLPEGDVVALLALGRSGDQQRLYTQQQEQEGSNHATDALLGGALNATVSSRVQKLFGAGSVKIDPNYIGALGNSTSRIIVEEQVGRNLTLTYATNVDTTQQQLLQAEIAINRHVSLLVARDESGVFSLVVKATRRFR